jgi:hypothetical protein
LQLSLKALRFVKGRHSPKTAAFVKSVFAYVAISIPAIDDPFARMRLYQEGGIAALCNNVSAGWRTRRGAGGAGMRGLTRGVAALQ